jgi:trehalose-6-phosphate synthase
MIGGVPHHRELIEAMLAYDLIGFQTEEDCENFLGYVQSDLGLVGPRRRRHLAPRPDPFRGISDRHRSRRNSPSRPPRRHRIRTCRGCGAA